MSESIFVNAKLRPRPGPVSYENKNTMVEIAKKKSKVVDKEAKMCGFIEASIKASSQVPGPIYNKDYKQIHSQERKPFITKESEKTKDKRLTKITTNKANPDFYELEKAMNKVAKVQPKFSMSKTKLTNFTDDYKKAKKYVPGVGKY